MKRLAVLLGLSCGWFALLQSFAGEPPAVPSELPVKGMVTMVDIGARKCIPCRMMAPIMEELEKEYKGKASIVFIDVWQNPEEGKNIAFDRYRRRSSMTERERKSTVMRVSSTRRALWPSWSNWE